MAASSIRSASSFGGSSDDVLMASGEDAPGIPTVETSALVDASGPGAADDGTRSTVIGLESVTVAGGSVNDRIVMGALDDTLSARGYDDVVTTAGGEDVHRGGCGRDVVAAGEGDGFVAARGDDCSGGRGSDRMQGGQGADALVEG